MKVENTQSVEKVVHKKVFNKNEYELVKKEPLGAGDLKAQPGDGVDATYEKAGGDHKIYSYDLSLIKELREGAEDLYGKLESLLREIVLDQDRALKLIVQAQLLGLDKDQVHEAEELIGEKGPRGLEAKSEQVVDFVRLAGDGSKERLNVLIRAIDRFFLELDLELEGLAEPSQKTYGRIREGLDDLLWTEILSLEKEGVDLQGRMEEILAYSLENQEEALEALEGLSIVRLDKIGDGGEPVELEKMSQEMVEAILRDEPRARELLRQVEMAELDILTSSKIRDLLGPEARLGSENISHRIVELLRLVSDEDGTRIYFLIRLVDQSFKEGRSLGHLSLIGQETHERTMEKLRERYPLPAILYQISSLYHNFIGTSKLGAKTYLVLGGLILLFYLLRSLA